MIWRRYHWTLLVFTFFKTIFFPDEAFFPKFDAIISSDIHDGNEFTVTQLNQVSTSEENILTENNSEINEHNLPHEPTGTSLSIDVSIY